MSKTAMMRTRIEPTLKVEAEAVLAKLGLSPTEAIRLFYNQILLQGGLPFDVPIPNAKTRAAIKEARTSRKLKTFKSAADLIRTVDA